MKNLTRVLALVLAMSLVLGTVAFAAFTDVKAGDDYAEAIETLAALGIIKGYEDGSFGADKAITRAEAVAIVNRIQGLEKAAAGAASASLYTDVAADHWALGDINLATQMGIISGDGNGKFRPEDQVSYQEMVKMLTCAVNYQPAVEDLGGWPTGYLVAAQTYGILEDTVNLGAAPANRAVVAQLTFNTLTAPLMVQEGFGTNKTYKVKDAEGATQTLLSEKLKIYKANAIVEETDKTGSEVGYAKVKIGEDTEDLYEVKKPNALDTEKAIPVVAGDNDLGNVGYSVVVYLQRNDDREWEVLYSTSEEGKNVEYVELAANVDEVVKTGSKPYVSVIDEDENETKYYIDDATTLYIKGDEDGKTATYVGKDINTALFTHDDVKYEGNVTFLYEDANDDAVKSIFVENWLTDVVEEIAPNGKSIYVKFNKTIVLDEEKVTNEKQLSYSITLDGKEIAITDLKEGDVVTYLKVNDGHYYNILVSRATVEGSVEAYYNEPDELYTIAGTDYAVSTSAIANGVDNVMNGSSMTGKTGVFTLDAFGKIVDFSKSVESKGDVNYGYILNVKNNFDEWEDTFAFEATARILTKDGFKDIDFADKVYVSPVVKTKDDYDADRVAYKIADPEATTGKKVTKYNDIDKEEQEVDELEADAFAAELAKFVGKDLIDYTLNSDGEISAIAYYSEALEADEKSFGDSDYITKNAELAQGDYNERNSKFSVYTVDADTVVFYVGDADREEWVVTDAPSFFVDDDSADTFYTDITVYNADDEKLAGAILVKGEDTIKSRSNLAVYVKYATVNDEDDQPVTQISYYEGGELKTINADDELTMTKKVAGKDVPVLTAGDVIEIDPNNKGLITEVPTIIANAANKDEYGYDYPELKSVAQYAFGQVIGKNSNVLKVGTDEENWTNHTVADSAKVYMVELKANDKINVTVSTVAEITRNRFYGDKGIDGEGTGAHQLYNKEDADNFQVLLKYVEGDVTDVVVYKNFLPGFNPDGK